MNRAEQLTQLRLWVSEKGLAAFILPMADEYLSEYVPPHAMRLAWLTGFDGSAGTVVVTAEKAALFTDGRYIIQAHQQLDTSLYDVVNMSQMKLATWLGAEVADQPVGYDAMLHSAAWVGATDKAGVNLKAINVNPIDSWWLDKPAEPTAPAWEYPLEYAGLGSKEKRAQITASFAGHKADALFISAAESIAWVLNVRGGDLECTPVLQAYALLHKDGSVQLFTNPDKVPTELASKLESVDILPHGKLPDATYALKGKTMLVDERTTPALLVQQAQEAGVNIIFGADPIEAVKAIKNDTELSHMREVHAKDGAALVKSFVQIDKWFVSAVEVDELKVDTLLNANREAVDGYVSLSFPAIVGAGEHGAIVHYRVTEKSNRVLEDGELLLIDSGGQYMGGTTDVTRTLIAGMASTKQKEHYTLVLKGHIALGRAVFPDGIAGSQLDTLARQYLWAEGLDYDHGTGHGVGACLGVHEGPQGISKRANNVPLKPGMILSNEPGYYPEGEYGIRIENLMEVVDARPGFFSFENLTLVPYARDLIDVSMLNADEIAYINHYHQKVQTALASYLDAKENAWLKVACAAI